jgi:hypothetical protein
MCHHAPIKREREEPSETIRRGMPAPDFFHNLILRILDFQETLSLLSGDAFKNRDAFYNSGAKDQATEALGP